MQKMDRLLGVMPPSNCGTEPNRIIRNPPWVIVYILAYYTNQDDISGAVDNFEYLPPKSCSVL